MVKNLIAPITANNKLGTDKSKGIIVATSYRPVGDAGRGLGTCPSTCAMLNKETGIAGDCYTKKFLVNNQQRNSNDRNDDLSKFLEKGATFVRLHTSGDFFKTCDNGYELDTEYLDSVIDFARNNPTVTFWTYCHDVSKLIDSGYTYSGNSFPKNLHITASCDDIESVNEAKKYGYRTARVITSVSSKMSSETLCPFDKALHENKKPNTTCAKCTLCFNHNHTKDIAFLMH